MALDCILTCKGHGQVGGSHRGGTKADSTRPLREFISGSDTYYKMIFKHAKDCTKCDPEEILRAYLNDRQRAKFFGCTSKGLVQLAFKYMKQFPGKIRDDTFKEFMWRIGDPIYLDEYSVNLSPEQVLNGLKVTFDFYVARRAKDPTSQPISADIKNRWKNGHQVDIDGPYKELIRAVATIYDAGIFDFPQDRQELEKLAVVCSVMNS
jgi:hypothetical protein